MWVKGLTPSLVKRAEIELNETPATRTAALEELILAIKDEPGFTPLMDEEFLLRFLRAKKFEVSRAFNTLKNYYDFKHRYSGDITDFLPKDLKSVFEADKVLGSPKRGFDGEGILILSAGSFNIDKFTPEQLFATTLVTAEIGIEAEFAQVCGCRIIFDFGGLTWWKLKHYVNPSFIGGVCKAIQDVMPIRICGIHVVNEPVYFTCAYQTIKPILSKKLKERVCIYFY
ncbi:Alpha-tocopherol transfer protein [Araneus ventricosus]|uniref:Alpha-tocopherol transfer protein n=1 Tax=Araneus ventricosus TaxID=182803 RepID=A0A4Y2MVL4_ARAVE|nr:Alpha-tocopherol transfer protein [Araneus ventricosus]